MKKGRTIFTDDIIARVQKNIRNYEWAARLRDDALQRAEEVCSLSDDFIWEQVPGPGIPRAVAVNQVIGCPSCGKRIDMYGYRSWLVDVLRMPWKVKCPSCGEIYPKNDFAAFYRSGIDESGVFVLEKADKDLLFNTEHADLRDPLRDQWVDDSTGYRDRDGNVFRFIATYAFNLWEWLLDSLVTLRDAYLYTAEPKYARKGLILLDRIADLYPDMDYRYWYKNGFSVSCGRSGRGRLYGRIWECFVAVKLCTAWDAFFPCISDDTLLKFLQDKGNSYKLKGKKGTSDALKDNIENNIVRHVMKDVRQQNIRGNSGMHQYAMAVAAISLDDPQETPEAIEWLFRPEAKGEEDGDVVLGGGLPNILVERMDRDGMGDEASPGYNTLWLNMLDDIYRLLCNYVGEDIQEKWLGLEKLRKSRLSQFELICLDRFVPNIGDFGSTGAPAMKERMESGRRRLSGWVSPEQYVRLFGLYKDPNFAQIAYYLNGGSCDGLIAVQGAAYKDRTTLDRGVYTNMIFDVDPEAMSKEIEGVVHEHGALIPKSNCLDGYGLAILRGGAGGYQRALWIYFGRSTGHGHRDTLNIGLYAFGLDLLPDLGYPEYADLWPKRFGWDSHTISHNTLLLDNRNQTPSYTGHLTLFKVSPGVQVVEAESDDVYPNAGLYKRTVCMVDVSEEAFYLVDFFRALGAEDYYYSFHAAEGKVCVDGANLVPQARGTYAGPDIEYGEQYDGDTSLPTYTGSGFQYLCNVERDPSPGEIVAFDWDIKDSWGILKEPRDIHLRLTLVHPDGEVALADGVPPQRSLSVPRTLKYVLLHRKAEREHGTSFVSVIEPYEGKRSILSISKAPLIPAPSNPVVSGFTDAVKIELENGDKDYVISSSRTDTTIELEDGIVFRGTVGFCRIRDGRMVRGYLIGGTCLKYGDRSIEMNEGKVTGKILDFDKEYSLHNRIYVDRKLKETVVGQWIRIINDGKADACYEIKGINTDEQGTWVDLGDVTFIRGFKNPMNYRDGLRYNFAEGDIFEIVSCKYCDWSKDA